MISSRLSLLSLLPTALLCGGAVAQLASHARGPEQPAFAGEALDRGQPDLDVLDQALSDPWIEANIQPVVGERLFSAQRAGEGDPMDAGNPFAPTVAGLGAGTIYVWHARR